MIHPNICLPGHINLFLDRHRLVVWPCRRASFTKSTLITRAQSHSKNSRKVRPDLVSCTRGAPCQRLCHDVQPRSLSLSSYICGIPSGRFALTSLLSCEKNLCTGAMTELNFWVRSQKFSGSLRSDFFVGVQPPSRFCQSIHCCLSLATMSCLSGNAGLSTLWLSACLSTHQHAPRGSASASKGKWRNDFMIGLRISVAAFVMALVFLLIVLVSNGWHLHA